MFPKFNIFWLPCAILICFVIFSVNRYLGKYGHFEKPLLSAHVYVPFCIVGKDELVEFLIENTSNSKVTCIGYHSECNAIGCITPFVFPEFVIQPGQIVSLPCLFTIRVPGQFAIQLSLFLDYGGNTDELTLFVNGISSIE